MQSVTYVVNKTKNTLPLYHEERELDPVLRLG